MLRLAAPSIDEDDVAAVSDVLRTGHLVQGRQVAAFEDEMALRTGATHAVALSSCTSSLHLSLVALGIRPGDRIAVPAYSWPATINVVALCGAEPVLVDVDPRTYNMNPDELAGLVRRTSLSAVIPVHTFGGMAAMDEITAVADAAGVPVIEDAACALGASLNGTQAGRIGRTGCFSFHPRKAITTGEGGVVITDDDDLAVRIRALRNHGLDPHSPIPEFIVPGFNVRMTDLQGALGLVQLRKLERILAARRELARAYDRLLAGSVVTTPAASPGARHAYQSYVVLLPEGLSDARDVIIHELRDAGIETSIGTHALPFLAWVKARYDYAEGDFPVVSRIAGRALSLPLHEHMNEQDQERVVACLLALVDHCMSERC